jgi:hypothetical protein
MDVFVTHLDVIVRNPVRGVKCASGFQEREGAFKATPNLFRRQVCEPGGLTRFRKIWIPPHSGGMDRYVTLHFF